MLEHLAHAVFGLDFEQRVFNGIGKGGHSLFVLHIIVHDPHELPVAVCKGLG